MHSILLQSSCALWLVMGTLFQGWKKGSPVVEVGCLLFIVCIAMFLGLNLMLSFGWDLTVAERGGSFLPAWLSVISSRTLFIGWMNKLSLLKILYTLKCFKYISMHILRVSVCWFSVGWVTWSYLHCDITVPRAEAREGELSFRSWVI